MLVKFEFTKSNYFENNISTLTLLSPTISTSTFAFLAFIPPNATGPAAAELFNT